MCDIGGQFGALVSMCHALDVRLIQRALRIPGHLGIFPGTFNPLTVAHVALARAALGHVDEVLFTLPRNLPHKEYTGASFEQRIALLRAALGSECSFSIGVSQLGLFCQIAEECRDIYGRDVRLSFLCGRDAAERIAGWDYGRPGAFREMLADFHLLVAARGGEYSPPAEIAAAVTLLDVGWELDEVSASEVRDRIQRSEPWEHLVPAAIHEEVRRIYRIQESSV
jgi:nicotinate-nucleotide adenylyltransferase